MYVIKRDNKRFNTKSFCSYEDARKYLRRKITELTGMYFDSFSKFGFSITKVA